jgi:hypothetical protein
MDDAIRIAPVPKYEAPRLRVRDFLKLIEKTGSGSVEFTGEFPNALQNFDAKTGAIKTGHRIVTAPFVGRVNKCPSVF